MQAVIFVAPPAAGKGTQSDLLCEKYNYLHISTGDLLREECQKESLEALYIKEKMEAGELVDDSLIGTLLEKKLTGNTSNFVLDGFPRNLKQAKLLDDILEKHDIENLYVIYIDVTYEEASKRIINRLSCPNCKRVYNDVIEELKPLHSGLCDSCNVQLVKRSDDNIETFTKRFNLYLEETKPLIDYYKNDNCLYVVDGSSDKMTIFNKIVEILTNK